MSHSVASYVILCNYINSTLIDVVESIGQVTKLEEKDDNY